MESEYKYPNEKRKSLSFRGILNYGMGVLWCAMGVFLMFPDKFSKDFERFNDASIKIFAGICIIYGVFRIYRGYKKNVEEE